ncbi:MAG: methyltransferase domain-containing protein [Acidovorax sp.]|uniref:methyltransferase domain-containing protein n=1 Tax=Acidovorax sp. TaxID=1872122 RepID=UPI0039195726
MILETLRSVWRVGYAAFRQRGTASQEAGGALPGEIRPGVDAKATALASGRADRTPFAPHAQHEAIRVVFLAQHASSWAGWRSIWQSAQRHPQVVAKVVLAPFVHHLTSEAATYDALRQAMLEEGIPFHPLAYFDLAAFAPHVVLVQNPYDETRPEGVRMPALAAMGARVVYVPYGLEMGGGAWNCKAQFDTDVQRGAWRVYSRSERHRQMFGKHCASGNGHVVVTGHPKFDGEDAPEPSSAARGWLEEAAGRKIVLWTPHFSVAGAPAWSTYNAYGNFILDAFERQPDLFLLVRPHPMLFSAIRQASPDGPSRESAFRERMAAMPNGALDELPSHTDAFGVSHALMADVGSFLLEYLPQDKPMLYLELQGGIGMNEDGELVEALHVARSGQDIAAFLDMVALGNDLRAAQRQLATRQFLYRLDKKAGERICQDIVEGVYRADPAANLAKRWPPELDQQSLRYWRAAQTTFLAPDHYYETKERSLVRTLEALGPVGTAIDVGCGTGRYTRVLARFADDVQGYDVSAGLVAQAREAAVAEGTGNVRFDCVAIEDLRPVETFDLVACLGVTSCVIDDLAFLAAADKLMQLVKPGGHVLLVDTLARGGGRVASDVTGYVAHYRTIADYQKVFERRGLRLLNSTELVVSEDGTLINMLWLFQATLRTGHATSDNRS